MKIYTYYEDINFNLQEPLVELWKRSWEAQGFEAVVLTKNDALTDPGYDRFVRDMEDIHMQVIGEPIKDYGMSCYLRWLAYSTEQGIMGNEKFFVSDYDIINTGVSPEQLLEIADCAGIHFLDHACPCLVYGSAAQFRKLCEDFVNVSYTNMDVLKSRNVPHWYHDQEFFIHNVFKDPVNLGDKLFNEGYYTSRIRPLIAEFPCVPEKDMLGRIVHFSHSGTAQLREKFPSQFEQFESNDEMRIRLIENTLNLM